MEFNIYDSWHHRTISWVRFIISGAISNKEGSLLFGGACLIIGGLWYLIYSLATLIPNLAILVRRFHDLSLSMLIPICFIVANFIIYIISNIIVENPNTSENGYALTFIMILNIFIWVFSIYVLVMTCLNSKKKLISMVRVLILQISIIV